MGDEDKKLSVQELERMILEKKRILWEEEISEKTLNDIDVRILRDYIKRANIAKRISFKYTNTAEVLNKLGLMKGNKLLNAAEVLFCKNTKLYVQAAIFAGVEKRTFLDISLFGGNIFRLLKQSESYIKERINWRADLTEQMRKEIPEIPVRAITESLVNSLCHRDYTIRKNNEIAIYKDRVEIYNPGQFPIGHKPQDFIKGKEKSILRNPLIAHILYLSEDIERWGSGLKRIYDSCKEDGVRVKFEELKTGFSIVFPRRIEGLEEGSQKAVEKTREKTREKIIRLIVESPKITTIELASKTGLTVKGIEWNLKSLRDKGILKRIGSDRAGNWKILRES